MKLKTRGLVLTRRGRITSLLASCAMTMGLMQSVAWSSTTTTMTEQPGLRANLISIPNLNTLNFLGGIVGGFASGNNNIAGGIKRFALPGQSNLTGAAAAGSNPWNAWVAYSRSNVGFSFSPLNSSGKVDVYLGGVDYTISNNMVLGVALAHDRTSVDLNYNGGRLSGDGYTISPYLGIAFDKNWSMDAVIGFGRSDVDASGGGVTGSTDVDRLMGSLGFNFRNSFGSWQVSARAAYLSVQDKLGAYTLSNGTLIADGTVNVSQLRAVGQIAYKTGVVTPYVSLSYIYDLRRPDQAPIAGVAAANDDDAWTPAVGLRFGGNGPFYGSFQYSTERGRSEVKNNQYQLNLGLRF